MLKTCNSLLRKLSKSCDTEFCGRILLFLAAIYPISERSAVNLMGKVNVNNVTYYEDQETFDQVMSCEETKKAEHFVIGEDGEEVEAKGLLVSYELYCKFWKLQVLSFPDSLQLYPNRMSRRCLPRRASPSTSPRTSGRSS